MYFLVPDLGEPESQYSWQMVRTNQFDTGSKTYTLDIHSQRQFALGLGRMSFMECVNWNRGFLVKSINGKTSKRMRPLPGTLFFGPLVGGSWILHQSQACSGFDVPFLGSSPWVTVTVPLVFQTQYSLASRELPLSMFWCLIVTARFPLCYLHFQK